MSFLDQLPSSVLQWFAIFLSIIIEALPFVILGAILSGAIEVYLTPERVNRFLPKNKFGRIIFGTFIGFVFPSCECGIVPIVNRFLEKQVPSYTAIPFMATAPIINPIVLFATYSAFGNSWRFMMLRFVGASLIAMALGILLAFISDENISKEDYSQVCEVPATDHDHGHDHHHQGGSKIFNALTHAIDEFFDTGRYLVVGSLVAAAMQIYIPTRYLTQIGHNTFMAILIMMLMAFILSLCSEADAFIGASLLSTFGVAPVLAFLLIGPMVDIKNLLMMRTYFKGKFIAQFVGLSTVMCILYCLFVGVAL